MFRKITLILTGIFTLLLGAPLAAAAEPITGNKRGSVDDFDYELWMDKGTGTGSMTLTGGGTYACEWENAFNVLFRTGKRYDETQRASELGRIYLDYGAVYAPDGHSYLCVYGWTVDPLIEFYIVESWGSWRPPGGNSKGRAYVDDGEYDIYETTRTEQPSIKGTQTFQQYWSVRTARSDSGLISISDHFDAWADLGLRLGKMYEIAFCVEGFNSSGAANIYSLMLTVGDDVYGSVSEPPEEPEPEEPEVSDAPDEPDEPEEEPDEPEPSEPEPETPPPPAETSPSAADGGDRDDDNGGGAWFWIWLGLGGAAVAVGIAVVTEQKKKKK